MVHKIKFDGLRFADEGDKPRVAVVTFQVTPEETTFPCAQNFEVEIAVREFAGDETGMVNEAKAELHRLMVSLAETTRLWSAPPTP